MSSLYIYFFYAIFLTLINVFFIYFYTIIAKNIGLVDVPTNRKIHFGNVPLIGGLSIFSSLVFLFLIVETSFVHKIIFLSSLIVFFVGLYDDKYNLGIIDRFFFQIIACLITVGFGIKIIDLGDYLGFTIYLGGFGILLTIVSMVGYINAINFSDGLDGLASGYILNCLISIVVYSYLSGNINGLEPLIFLIIFITIFLLSNFGFILPKSFLGDSGSTALGFLVSCYLIHYTMPENRYFHPVLVLWASSLPTFDFFTVFFKRLMLKKNPFRPDRLHLHYLLISSKISNKMITPILVSFSFLLSIIGYLVYFYLGSAHSLIFFLFSFLIYFLTSIYIGNKE